MSQCIEEVVHLLPHPDDWAEIELGAPESEIRCAATILSNSGVSRRYLAVTGFLFVWLLQALPTTQLRMSCFGLIERAVEEDSTRNFDSLPLETRLTKRGSGDELHG